MGTAEIYRSLHTSSAKEARRRSAALWIETGRIFDDMKKAKDGEESIEVLRDKFRDILDKLTSLLERQESLSDFISGSAGRQLAVGRAKDVVKAINSSVDSIRGDFEFVDRLISSEELFAGPRKLKPSPMLTKKIDDYVAVLRKPGDNDKQTSEQTIAQIGMSIRLFMEFFGEKPVREYTKEHAGEFKRLLAKLPASHGKSRSNVLTAPKAIEQNDKLETPKPGLSPKTIKRHFSGMSSYWNWLKESGHVDEVIFYGHKHRGAGSKKGQRDDWSEEDLLKVLKSEKWYGASMDRQSGYHWLPLISMFTGMRAEEIARLRPQDIEDIEGVSCFNIQEHPDGWSPKTEAGERLVPVHSMLKQMGWMEFVKGRQGQERLFYDFQPTGVDGKYSTKFSREFSRFKIGLGIGKKTVFHSFRHSVRTILDNSDATIRDSWIDAVMGHAADENASIGRRIYMKRTEIDKAVQVVDAIRYPQEITDFLIEKFC